MKKINFQVAEHAATAGAIDQCPNTNLPEIVMAGRSNVGKSSLINALTNKKALARVSQKPGKTRLLIYFLIDNLFYLTDLPGYGYAAASHEEISKFSALADQYLQSNRNIAMTLLLVDIRVGPTENDLQMLEWLDYHGEDYMLIFTKADKFSPAKIKTEIFKMKNEGKIPEHCKYHVVSSSKRTGIEELRLIIEQAIYLHG